MLTNLEANADRSWTWKNRLPAAALLLAIGLGVTALPAPSRGGDEAAPKVALKEAVGVGKPRDAKPTPAIDLSYLPADAKGFMAFQPAAICRREGMSKLVGQMNAKPDSRELLWIGLMEFGGFPYVYSNTYYTKDDMPTTDSRFRIEQVEQISNHFSIDPLMIKGQKFWRITPHGHMIRMVEPFDWEKQARIWWPKLKAVTGLQRAYYRINSRQYVDTMCAFFPDDRTLVMDSEANVRMLINRENPAVPQFVEGLDWEKLRRSLFVLAINNHDHRMAGILKKENGRDAVDASRIFEQADVWAFHLEDSDSFSMKAFATFASSDKGRPLAVAAEKTLLEFQSMTLNLDSTDKARGDDPGTAIRKMFADILKGYEVVPSGTTVDLIPKPAVKLADFFAAMGRYALKQSCTFRELMHVTLRG